MIREPAKNSSSMLVVRPLRTLPPSPSSFLSSELFFPTPGFDNFFSPNFFFGLRESCFWANISTNLLKKLRLCQPTTSFNLILIFLLKVLSKISIIIDLEQPNHQWRNFFAESLTFLYIFYIHLFVNL